LPTKRLSARLAHCALDYQAARLAPPLQGYPLEMAVPADSRGSFIQRALPIYFGLLFAILTVVAAFLSSSCPPRPACAFVSVLLAAALTGPSEWLHRRVTANEAM
jgi:hypothetical protein